MRSILSCHALCKSVMDNASSPHVYNATRWSAYPVRGDTCLEPLTVMCLRRPFPSTGMIKNNKIKERRIISPTSFWLKHQLLWVLAGLTSARDQAETQLPPLGHLKGDMPFHFRVWGFLCWFFYLPLMVPFSIMYSSSKGVGMTLGRRRGMGRWGHISVYKVPAC